jgi:hypothetical protein
MVMIDEFGLSRFHIEDFDSTAVDPGWITNSVGAEARTLNFLADFDDFLGSN